MVDYFCCPAPVPHPDGMILNETTKRYRTVLYTLVYGELGVIIGQGFLFGPVTAILQLFNMWVTYIAYGSMHPCCIVIMGFVAAMECLMLFMNASDGAAM